jgi:ABC-2 type transport system permease protein
MYFVLTRIFPSTEPNFALYLLIGNVFITFWNDGTGMGMDSLLGRAGLITKVNFPRYTVLISSTAISVVNFLINMSVVTIFMLMAGIVPTFIQIIWFFFCVAITYLLILVTSMFISVVYVRFRDLKQIWELFNQLLFWSTPIFYSIDSIVKKSAYFDFLLTKLNPLSVLLLSARSAVLKNDIFLQPNVFAWLGIITVIGIFGYIFYTRSIKKIAEYF